MTPRFLLDTNIPAETLRPLPNAQVAAWLERQAKEAQFLIVVTIGELRRGATLLAQGPGGYSWSALSM